MSVSTPTTVPNPLNPSTFIYVYPYPAAPGGVAVDTTSLQSGHHLNSLTLDTMFSLLVSMINALQQASVAQAGQLQFLNSWQNAITGKMSGVHQFVQSNSDAPDISGSDSSNSTRRQDLNLTGSTYTENMRAQNQTVQNTAKQMQTNIGQLQQAVSQQSNMASSIVQQMATILSVMFR